MNRAERLALYSVAGCFLEVAWTAIGTRDFRRLEGHVSLYMTLVYGPALLALFEPAADLMRRRWRLRWPLRALLYAAAFLVVEYGAGRALRLVLGEAPWDYRRDAPRLHLDGLIRLDYGPCWAVVGLGCERLVDAIRPPTPASAPTNDDVDDDSEAGRRSAQPL